jgi:N4-gp56 family major capsid protein
MKKGNVPLPSDGFYRLYVGNEVAHDLRTDTTSATSWVDLSKYTDRVSGVFAGEIGVLNGFRVIEADTAPTFSSTTTVYGSLAMGAISGWGAGELQTFQAYHVAPGGDHSDPLAQIEEVGWKMNFGVAPLNNGYYYRVESAARAL